MNKKIQWSKLNAFFNLKKMSQIHKSVKKAKGNKSNKNNKTDREIKNHTDRVKYRSFKTKKNCDDWNSLQSVRIHTGRTGEFYEQ